MGLQDFFSGVSTLGIAVEFALLIVLFVRHQNKAFPVFTLYLAYNLLSDLLILGALAFYSVRVGRSLQFATIPLQYLLELGVLFEIAWKVIRPVHSSLPRGLIRAFVVLVALAILAGSLLAWHVKATGNMIDDIERPLNLTVGLLRLLIFAVTAGFAQMLGIGWKNKVLQLATALSFYSAGDLTITLAERHLAAANALDPIRAVFYLLEIAFLLWVFTTKEVLRREFSPQMEQFLVTLAGRAKDARTALVRIQVK